MKNTRQFYRREFSLAFFSGSVKSTKKNAKTLLIVAASASMFLLGARQEAYAQEGGHWEYEWSKSGKNQGIGVLNHYSNFPQVAFRETPQYNTPWNIYNGTRTPLEGGAAIGELAGMATDESVAVTSTGSLGFTLVWVPGINNELPPRKIILQEEVRVSTEAASYILEPAQGTIYDYNSVVKTKFPELNDANIITSSVTHETSNIEHWQALEFITHKSATTRLTVINNPKRKSRIPLGTATAFASTSWFVVPGETQGASAILGADRLLSEANISLGLRRHGSGETFSSSTTVAAGHKQADEHLVDVQVSVQPMFNLMSPVAGLKVPFQVVLPRDWKVTNGAKFIPAENPVTDSQGKAIIGVIKSSDKLTFQKELPPVDKRILVRLNLGLEEDDPKAYINQVWDDSNQWTMKPYLLGDEESTIVKFHPKFSGVHITDHKMTMHVAKIKVTFWNSVSNAKRTRIITTNPAEVDLQSIPQVVLGDPEKYAAFEEETISDEGDGTYKGTLKFLALDTVTIEQIWFKARDEEVYKQTQP